MKKMGDLTTGHSGIESLDEEKLRVDEKDIPKVLKEKVFIKHINGPLFFGSTSDFQQLIKQIPNTASIVIIRMKKMDYIDQTGLYAIEDAVIDLIKNGKIVLFTGLSKQPLYMMERVGLIPNLIPKEKTFKGLTTCLKWIEENATQ